MRNILLPIVVLINIAPFIFEVFAPHKFDIWQTQGIVFRIWAAILIMYSLIVPPKRNFCDIPLACLFGFIVLRCFWSFVGFSTATFSIEHLLQPLNFLLFVFSAKVIIERITHFDIKKLFIWMRYSLIFTLLVCAAQKLGVAQGFYLLFKDNQFADNLVSGFIGNGTHLSGFLAMLSPLLFEKRRESILALILMLLVASFSGQNMSDIAISGPIIVFILGIIFLFFKSKKIFSIVFGFSILTFLIIYGYLPEQLFSFNGRIGWWSAYLPQLKQTFIFGCGLGTVESIRNTTKILSLHLEPYQFLIELGVIGFGILVWNIKEFIEIKTPYLLFYLMFIGYLLGGLFTYPQHLWLPSTYALLAYCVVKSEQMSLLR